MFQQVPDCDKRNACCYDLAGNRHGAIPHMPAMILVTPDVSDFCHEAPIGPDIMLRDCHALSSGDAVTVRVPNAVADDWWLAFPTHLAHALGFGVEHSRFPPPEGSDMLFSLTGDRTSAFAIGNRQGWLRVLLLLAPVRHAARAALASSDEPLVRVEIQLVANHSGRASCRPRSVLNALQIGGVWQVRRLASRPRHGSIRVLTQSTLMFRLVPWKRMEKPRSLYVSAPRCCCSPSCLPYLGAGPRRRSCKMLSRKLHSFVSPGA